MNTNQLQDLATTRAAIVDAARVLGCAAQDEYPGYVSIAANNGRIAFVGTANGPWQFDVFRTTQDAEEVNYESEGVTVPASHNTTPEGIARYVAGMMTGIIEWRAYASEDEAKRANKADRRARGHR